MPIWTQFHKYLHTQICIQYTVFRVEEIFFPRNKFPLPMEIRGVFLHRNCPPANLNNFPLRFHEMFLPAKFSALSKPLLCNTNCLFGFRKLPRMTDSSHQVIRRRWQMLLWQCARKYVASRLHVSIDSKRSLLTLNVYNLSYV